MFASETTITAILLLASTLKQVQTIGNWAVITTSGRPSARGTHSGAYIAQTDEFLLFSGIGGALITNQLYT